ncbi:MAG: hypothetical protein ABR583_03645 [Gaiellaceae bacterium]
MTLVGVAVAGGLIWLASEIFHPFSDNEVSNADYWAFAGLMAAAGFVIALSQLLGGWTKWGWPRISLAVFILGFLPTLVASLWVIGYLQPDPDNWLASHLREWTDDLGIEGFVQNFLYTMPALAFGTGLVFGLVFDTSGPRVRREPVVAEEERPPVAGAGYAPPSSREDVVGGQPTAVRAEPADEQPTVVRDEPERRPVVGDPSATDDETLEGERSDADARLLRDGADADTRIVGPDEPPRRE